MNVGENEHPVSLPNMAMTDHPSADAARDGDDPARSGSRLGWGLAVTVCLLFVAMWVYILPREGSVKPAAWLTDRRFPAAAEPVCARAMKSLDRLPNARDSVSAADRAMVVAQATTILRQMTADLRPLVPGGGERAKFIYQWIDDWSIYLGDRDDYVTALRRDASTEFLVTVKYGTQLSKSLDNFADVNKMESCGTPGDV